MWPNSQFLADLVTFTEEMLNGKLIFCHSVRCGLLPLNLGAWEEHLNSQMTWAAAWLLVIRICPVYLVDDISPCVLWPLMIELMVVLFDVFLDGEYGFASTGSWCYSRGWERVVVFDIFWMVRFYFYRELMLF